MKRNPTVAFVITLVLINLATFVSASLYGLLFDTAGFRGFLDDWNFFFTDFVLIPALAYWYIGGPRITANLWERLERSDVIDVPPEILEGGRRRAKSSVFVWGGILICLVTLWATYWSNSYLLPKPWWFANWVVLIIRLSTWGFAYYIGAVVVLREVVTLFDLSKAFSASKVRLCPYHPDKNNGFSFVVAYLVRFTGLAALFGATLAIWLVWLWSESMLHSVHGKVVYVGLGIYILLTPTGFLVPLRALHQAMLKAKEKLLEDVAAPLQEFLDELYEKGMMETENMKTEDYDSLLKCLQHQEGLYSFIDKYPTWPFRIAEFRRFLFLLLSGLSPLLSLIPSFLDTVFS